MINGQMMMHRRKLVVVGDTLVGKTSLFCAYVHRELPEWIPNEFGGYVAKIEVDSNNTVDLGFWDTVGQREYDILRPLHYPGADVVLLCFCVDSPDSLKHVEEKWENEVKHFCPKVPIILVATKTDLRNDEQVKYYLKQSKQEPIQTREGKEMAEKIGAFAYLECSAKLNEGVRDVFNTAAKASLQFKEPTGTNRSCVLV